MAPIDGQIAGKELLAKYSNPRYLGTVSAATLRGMRERLAAAASGRMQYGEQTLTDAGNTFYVGYDYSRRTDTYREVLLAALNGGGINTGDVAKLLTAWLHSLECLYGVELPSFKPPSAGIANLQATLTSVRWVPPLAV